MEEKKAARNGFMDVMRLGFAGLLIMYHFYYSGQKHFPGGAFGVEFFTILAGFLMFSAWDRHHVSEQPLDERQRYWLGYMKKRYVRFFWYGLPAFIFTFLVIRIWRDNICDIAGVSDMLSKDIWEVLLIKMNGLNRGNGVLNAPAWTMSCMLFSEFFILGMLTFAGKQFLAFLLPLSLIFCVGYWANNYTGMGECSAFFTIGMLRIYILTCLGIFSYWICKKMKATHFSRTGRWTLTILELLGYTICVLIMLHRKGIYYQLCFSLTIMMIVAVSFSGKSFAGSILPANGLTNFCAELSLNLYLSHWPIVAAFRHIFKDVDDLYRQKFIFLCCALAAALAYTYIMRGVFKLLPIIKEKLRSVMLEE